MKTILLLLTATMFTATAGAVNIKATSFEDILSVSLGIAAEGSDGKFAAAGSVAMTIVHGLFAHWVNEFRYDRNSHSQKFFRIINEIPTVMLVIIVILATVKPF